MALSLCRETHASLAKVFFCFLKRDVKGRGEQCGVYFKAHLDFISSKSCELQEQGEEPLAPWFSFPSSSRPFPVSALEVPEGSGD